jgi:hypothetical protein
MSDGVARKGESDGGDRRVLNRLAEPRDFRVSVGEQGARDVGRCGKDDSALKIRPPLVFERAHADLLVARLDEALEVAAR